MSVQQQRIAEVIAEDGGCWRPCSGCQESVDGYVSERDYPYSEVFQCQPGGGCSECGGIGVIWENGASLASYGDDLSGLLSEPEDFLAELRRVNTDRYLAWVGDGGDAGILFDAAELGGEVGELLNVVKKLVREDQGWRGSRAAPDDFADECADVLICLDKLARRRGVDLRLATIAKFNAASVKQGFPHKLMPA